MTTPTPAATVVLLRSGVDGLEALLTHRPSSMAFAPDVHVFPGGRVDELDLSPAVQARSVVTPEAASDAKRRSETRNRHDGHNSTCLPRD